MRLLLMIVASLLLPHAAVSAAPATPPPLESAIGALAREQDFSGTILVVDRGRDIYRQSFGLADRAFQVPHGHSTRYKVASITKLFTSALILRLRDEGKLDLAAPAQTYLPELKGRPAGAITVHQLLNHTSGLPQWDNVASYQEAFEKGVERYQRPLAPLDLEKLCCLGPLAAPPGTRFDYNNADYFLLGRIVERLTGRDFETALSERILRPLRLESTGMLRWDRVIPRLAPTYFYREDTSELINDLPIHPENGYAGAAMYSTAGDLAVFADALFGARLVKPASLDLLLRPGLDDYGYGLWSYTVRRGGRAHRVAKRPGRVMGANAVLYRLLDRPATIVILANTNRADLDLMAQRIADRLIG
ncbi:MAG TPA: serine hydrolase domain-containing protein [Allosphingosinicella sp.]|jgi:CubicO group peptidase (beta-lactamase class C family)